MSNKHASDVDAGRGTSRAGRTAWAGRVMLALVPLAVLVATGDQMLQLRAEERWREFSEALRRAPLPETRQAIDVGVDEAFAPVYAAMPSLLDWHYSFIGQYAELGLALTGRLEEEIESRLFGALDQRISLGVADVGRVMQEEMLTEIQRFSRPGRGGASTGVERWGGRAMEALLRDARRHFVMAIGPTAVAAATAGVGTSVGVTTLTRGLAEKLAGGVALRVAGARPGPCGGVYRGRRRGSRYRHRTPGVGRVAQPGRARAGADRVGGRGKGEREGHLEECGRRGEGEGAGGLCSVAVAVVQDRRATVRERLVET